MPILQTLLKRTTHLRHADGSALCSFFKNEFLVIVLFSSPQRLKFEIAEVMTEIEQLTCVGER